MLESCVPPHVEKAFAWGFQFQKKDVSLPWAYILPKHKKEWKGGRPIISFCCHPARLFLVGLSKVIDFLVLETCAHCKTYNDALSIWKDVHRHLDAVSNSETACEEQCFFNQDLAGFFISIPQERFGVALRFMLCRLYNVAFFSDLPAVLVDKRVTVRLDKMKRYGRFSKASFAELVAKMFAFLWRCFSQLWIALSSSTCFVWGDMFLSKGWARQWGAQFLLRYATLL